jgi:hypothetical protein
LRRISLKYNPQLVDICKHVVAKNGTTMNELVLIPDDESTAQLVPTVPEPLGYVIPLLHDGPPETTFVHLFSKAFTEHFGPECFQRVIGRVIDCACVVKARLEELRGDTVKVYFNVAVDDEYECHCIFYLAEFPNRLMFDVFDF